MLSEILEMAGCCVEFKKIRLRKINNQWAGLSEFRTAD